MPREPGFLAAHELLANASFLARLARELTSDEHAAADLVQETYRVALERPPRDAGPIRGWLAAVLANLARNRQRGEGRREEREQFAARDERIEETGHALERLELQRALVELVLALPEEQRTVLYLRYYEDEPPSAIARRLGVPVATVKTRHTRAVNTLRARLDARSSGDRQVWMSALAVLASTRATKWASTGIGAAIGGAMAKKLMVAAAIVVAALFAWRVGGPGLQQRFDKSRSIAHSVSEPIVSTPPAPPALSLEPAALASREPNVAATPPPTTGALDARFLWADGSPAAEIGVGVTCEKDPAPREEVFRAITDQSGVARFAELFAGNVELVADARGRFNARVEAGGTRTVEFRLDEATDVVGRVVGPNGDGIVGALIVGQVPCRNCSNQRVLTRSGADGSFQLRSIDAQIAIGARARGFLPSLSVNVVEMPAERTGVRSITLMLREGGGSLTGRVLDPDGNPIAGARVVAGPRGGHGVEENGVRAVAPRRMWFETADDGTFEIIGAIEAGRQSVFATARGFPVVSSEVEISPGQTTHVEIRLEAPARVEGRLLDVEHRPIANVRVLAAEEDRGGWYWPPFSPPEDSTDENGRFTLDWLAPGKRELNANDYARPEIGRARASVDCVGGVTTTCELQLTLGGTIAGRVVDSQGAPLENWAVRSETSSMRTWHPRRANTDRDGRFVLANLGDGPHTITAFAPDTYDARGRIHGVDVGTDDLELVVDDATTASGRLIGRMIDQTGSSLEDVIVTLWKDGENAGHFVDVDPKTGRFEAVAAPGRHRLDFRRGVQSIATRSGVEIEANSATDVGDVVFESLGRVEIEMRGVPAAQLDRLRFYLSRPDVPMLQLTTEGGVLRSPEIMSGTWTLFTNEQEIAFSDTSIDVAAGTTTRYVREIVPAIVFRFRFANVKREEFTVDARDSSGALVRSRSFAPGTDTAPEAAGAGVLGLPVGRYEIVLRTQSGLEARHALEVHAGNRRPEPIELVPR